MFEVVPTPESVTPWLEPETLPELSTTVIRTVAVPAADGVKTIERVQLLPTATVKVVLVLQVEAFVALKLIGVGFPVRRMLLTVAAALPEFAMVTVMGALVCPTVVVGKVSVVAVTVTTGEGVGPVLPEVPPPQPVRRKKVEANNVAREALRNIRKDPILSVR